MNKQQLAAKIWESANKMRSKIEANEYKDYILGFIFYKFLSETEIARLRAEDWGAEDLKGLDENDAETVQYVRDLCGYFISYNNLFSTWIASQGDFTIADVRDALSAFERNIDPARKRVFVGIFDTLQTGLSKLGTDEKSRSKAVRDLIYLIKDIPMDSRQDYDTLGFIYEYLISNFASNAGKKAGEFYTPSEVSQLMSEIVAWHLAGREEINIYDPTSGSGSLLIHIGQAVARRNGNPNDIKYYAQELKENTYNLTRMNLVMRGILPDNIVARNGDTLKSDWPWFDTDETKDETYEPLFVDAVVSNPPYSQNWEPPEAGEDIRFEYGIAPKSKADYAFLLHDLYHLRDDGIMAIVLPHGVLFRGGEEGEIRKNLIENNHIDAIIGLPANIFFGTGIPTIIMVLRQKRENTDVLIIDASKGFIKEGKNNKLRASDIKRIADTFIKRESVPKFSRVVSREEIRSNDYNLNIPRYVESSEAAEHWDVYASMFGGIPTAEIEELGEFWTAFPALKKALFTESGIPYVNVSVDDIKSAIKSHPDVVGFEDAFNAAFSTFPAFLKEELIDRMESIEISKAETVLSADIFERLKDIPLIDKYAAFQLLDDDWTGISIDLEVLQTEGFSATKEVDPNLVIKKKDGKDQEVQEGWVGHIIPFDLVQATLLSAETDELHGLESRLAEIPSEYESILDEMTEEDKESCNDVLTEEGYAFFPKEVSKKIKELKKDRSPESVALRTLLEKVESLVKSEKEIKAEIKAKSAALQAKTKDTIERLSDEQALDLLEKKWIAPLIESIHKLPDTVIDSLVSKIQALQNKYATTFFEVEQQISETEATLSGMIDDLEGNEYDMLGLNELKKLLGGSAE